MMQKKFWKSYSPWKNRSNKRAGKKLKIAHHEIEFTPTSQSTLPAFTASNDKYNELFEIIQRFATRSSQESESNFQKIKYP
jgi:hypothetical protein